MKPKTLINLFAILTLALALGGALNAGSVHAQNPGLPGGSVAQGVSLGTGFTYQGRLTDASGNPIAGPCDLRFTLYQSAAGNDPVGAAITANGVTTDNGYFSVELDFGATAFTGDERFLKIEVDCGSGYTALSPRVKLTPAPYAIYAAKAPWSGLSGIPAGFADGTDDNTTYTAGTGLSLAGTQFNVTGAPWSGLTGVPAGFADGTDDNTTYTAGDGLELAGTQFSGKGTSYQNVVIVAKSGGDFTSIQAALDSITDATWDKHYLVYIAPGVYTEQVTMKPYVDIEGAGELTTKITYTGSASPTTGTVVGTDSAELRFLTVENTGGAAYAVAIYNNGASPRLTHITASASGGNTFNSGVYNYDFSSPTMTNVTASASGGTNSHGVYNDGSSSPTMTNVTASASGGTFNSGVYNYSSSSPTMTNVTASASGGTYSYGVYNYSSSPTMTNVTASASGGTYSYGVYNYASSPTMTNVTASASGGTYSYGVYNYALSPTMTNVTASASGGTNSYGVYNDDFSSPTMTNVTASASGGTNSYGVYNTSSPTIQNSVIRASSGTSNYGIYNAASSGAYTVLVNNSQISGSTNTIYNDAEFTTRVGASQLDGGAVYAGGTMTCAGVYDENYVFYANTCP